MKTGTVVVFHPDREYGYVRRPGEPAAFFYSHAVRGVHPGRLRVGQAVTYATSEHEDGWFRAVVVRPITAEART